MKEIDRWLLPSLVAVAFSLQLIFLVCHTLFTRWRKERLGPYVVRLNAMIFTVLTLAMLARFAPGYNRFRDWTSPFGWLLVVMIILDQLRVLLSGMIRRSRGAGPGSSSTVD